MNPQTFLDHGVLGVLAMVLFIGMAGALKLAHRAIDVFQSFSREQINIQRDQVDALIAVESAVRESMTAADKRHSEVTGMYLKSTEIIVETRDTLRRWADRCRSLCGKVSLNDREKPD